MSRLEGIVVRFKAIMENIMPIYEYMCPNCQNIFEKWLKLSETTEHTPCPKCGSQAQHIISNTAFVLKGGGWYVTDYGYRKGASEDSQTTTSDAGTSSASSTASGSEQSTDPAPAAAAPDQHASSATNPAT
jgi:putative FmdB family regulatory protein